MKRKDALIATAVVVAFVIFGALVMRGLGSPGAPTGLLDLEGPPAGAQIELQGVEWARGDRTLLLVVSQGCRFCTESARFYRRLAREASERGGVQLVAVVPQDVATGRGYLKELGVDIGEVHSAPLDTLGVQGTPTLILVDRAGRVVDSWAGQLPPDREEQVVEGLFSRRAA
jgi:hypothetical protein